MPVGLTIEVKGDRAVVKVLGTLSKDLKRALGVAILQEAHTLRALIVKGIRDQAPGGMKFKPLSETTRRLRMMQRKGSARTLSGATSSMRTEMKKRTKAINSGPGKVMSGSSLGVRSSSRIAAAEKKLIKSDARIERAENKLAAAIAGMKALINSGSLIGSVNVTKLGKDPLDGVFVGVHRNARRKKGKGGDPVSIAAAMEFGSKSYTVAVTPKMRKWWFAMYKAGVFAAPLKRSTTSIKRKTPARPYIRPSVSVWKQQLEDRLGRRIQQEIDKVIAAAGGKGK